MIQWDKKLTQIAEETAAEAGVTTDQVKDLVVYYMQRVANNVRSFVPAVIPCIGVLRLNPLKTVRSVLKMFGAVRKGTMTEEDLRNRLPRYLELHKRARTHAPRRGKVWKFLRKKAFYEAQRGGDLRRTDSVSEDIRSVSE